MNDTERLAFEKAAGEYPFPIASACRKFRAAKPEDQWKEWEALSRDVLQPILQYLTHLLLSDLVATGRKPPALFHRIQSVLTRPMAGHYAGFLRETARWYRDENVPSALPELVSFLHASEVECVVAPEGKAFVGLLVDYRNLWAHGRFDNAEALGRTVDHVRALTAQLLGEIAFLVRWPLRLEDGTSLMVGDAASIPADARPLVVVTAGDLVLRPLLVKLKGPDLVLLEESDLDAKKLFYRGSSSSTKLTKKDLAKGDGAALLGQLHDLLLRVRSDDALLPAPGWEDFSKRASLVSDRTLSLYEEMRKHVPGWYVPRPSWEGDDGVFGRFLASDKSLLAVSGVQGTGKSALVSHLVSRTREQGHAVLFVNAQRLTFADVAWTGNPIPGWFSAQLRYEAPLDRGALARVLKGAPEGRKVVLFVDAVNEVDGLENKWNRFRAMELLLEWVVSVAQPGLKVVLSFRLDAYEEFGYLEADELPAGLAYAVFPGTNPRKPWVTDLEPFGEEQAAALFGKLRVLPEHGMAPQFSWEEAREALGPTLDEITSNPLLFTIFLRRHHGEVKVLATEPEALFLQYAEKLTGAVEERKRPRWTQIVGFLRNGNVTPKERFLVDAVDRMAEEGGASFLVERLDPKRSKRDRRLLEVVSDPGNRTWKDLLEGGLLAEEKIEERKSGKEVGSRRVTFVAELLSTAMEGIVDKVTRIGKVRKTILFLAGVSAVVASVVGFTWVLVSRTMVARITSVGLAPGEADRAVSFLGTWVLISAGPFVLLGVVFSAMVQVFLERRESVRDLGALPSACLRARKKLSEGFTIRMGLLGVAPALAWLVLRLGPLAREDAGTRALVVALAPLVATVLALVTVAFSFRANLLEARAVQTSFPSRLLRMAFARRAEGMAPKRVAGWRRRAEIAYAAVAVAALAGTAAYHFLPSSVPGSIAVEGSRGVLFAQFLRFSARELPEVTRETVPVVGLLFAVVMLALVVVRVRLGVAVERKFAAHCRDHPDLPPLRFGELKVAALVWALVLAWCLPILAATSWALRKDDVGPLRALGLPQKGWTLDGEGRVVSLDLSGHPLDAAGARAVAAFRQLVRLELDPVPGAPLDLGRLAELQYLDGPPGAFVGLERRQLKELTLRDAEGFLATSKGVDAAALTLQGRCSSLGDFPSAMPFLVQVTLDEEIARRTAAGFRPPWENLILRIRSEGPPALDWFTAEHARCVLSLPTAPGPATLHLDRVQRLRIPAEGLDPETLRRATSLRWLALHPKKPIDPEWGGRLADVLAALPAFRLLEIVPDGDLRKLRSARTPAGIRAILEVRPGE